MSRLLFVALFLVAGSAAAQLTETETRWLRAGLPVLDYAKAQSLPIDVIVQPQDTPDHAPLAMDFVAGRCKLVLSMRGNPQADAALAGVPQALEAPVIEAITAHEVGHCWRHVNGTWNVLPAGFIEVASDGGDDRARQRRAMRATRREEGFADLVGLAWTAKRHPALYGQVHAWFVRVRDDSPLPGSHHDTHAWLKRAKDRAAFAPGDSPFGQAHELWRAGLLDD
jgi:hypothetical protein